MVLDGFLVNTQFLLLGFHCSNQIIDYVGQSFNLNILHIDTTIKLVNKPADVVGGLTHKVNTFRQSIQGMVLCQGNTLDGQLEMVSLHQEVGSNNGSIMRGSLAPHL
jgi:hypothetical protein